MILLFAAVNDNDNKGRQNGNGKKAGDPRQKLSGMTNWETFGDDKFGETFGWDGKQQEINL